MANNNAVSFTRTLKYGMSGDDVETVQDWLNTVFEFWGDKTQVQLTGRYLNQTYAAVKHFQRRSNNAVTGVVDRATWDDLSWDVYCYVAQMSGNEVQYSEY